MKILFNDDNIIDVLLKFIIDIFWLLYIVKKVSLKNR